MSDEPMHHACQEKCHFFADIAALDEELTAVTKTIGDLYLRPGVKR